MSSQNVKSTLSFFEKSSKVSLLGLLAKIMKIKPEDYHPGDEKILKKFRPIALSNVAYKTTTAIIAKRLSRWLQENHGIGWTQRAIFNRNGVRDNALLVNAALQEKRPVIFLDLSDAFNSVKHSAIFDALDQSGCPPDLANLIKSLYRDCSTSPVNLAGEPLCGEISVTKGVKQGCPLSSLLFNLVLDPLLRTLTTEKSTCLGYMDDMAIILDKDLDPTLLLNEIKNMAKKIGLTFNILKCGVLNNVKDFYIGTERIPPISESETQSYKFLGTDAKPKKLTGVLKKFNDEIKPMMGKIMGSKLTPMQNLHSFRTCVIPKILHIVSNSSPLYSDLDNINKFCRATVKKICYLPGKAINAYVHLARYYGGPGIPDMIWLRRCMVLANTITVLNSSDRCADLLKILTRWKNAEDLVCQVNSGKKSGLHPMIKELAQSLDSFSKLTGSSYKLFYESSSSKIELQVDNAPISAKPWIHLKNTVDLQNANCLLQSPNQGRFWQTLIRSPTSTKAVFNFHTRMCDWRYLHKARLNLTPLRGAIPWSNVDKTCRRCQGANETLNHVANACSTHRKSVIQRHNDVRKHLADQVPSHMRVAEEQRFADAQPDMVIQDHECKRTFIVDIKVSNECEMNFAQNAALNMEKYSALRGHFERKGHAAHIITFQLGCLGSLSQEASHFLYKLLRNNRKTRTTIRVLSSIAAHSTRNILIEHLTGKEQRSQPVYHKNKSR